jgi:hypothetical protein
MSTPDVTLQLQFESAPLHRDDLETRALVTLTPPAPPTSAYIVLALDVSLSMRGAPIALLSEFLNGLMRDGIAGKSLFLRILFFGGDVLDMKIGEDEFVQLSDASRPEFQEMIDAKLHAHQTRTNISAVLLEGVKICKKTSAPSHVVCLTDGVANAGIEDGGMLHAALSNEIGDRPVFVHLIGLGSALDAPFLRRVTAVGRTGVFSCAPSARELGQAFEDVFGLALDASRAFCFDVTDANGTRVERHGMLAAKRSVLIDVRLPRVDAELYETSVVNVQMRGPDGLLGESVWARIEFAGVEFARENPDVKAAAEREELEAQAHLAQESAGSIYEVANSLREIAARASEHGYGAAALARLEAMVEEADEAGVVYRSMGDGRTASKLFAVQSQSQSAYH